MPALLEQQREEVDLEQHVAELVQQLRVVTRVRRVGQLVGLLDGVGDDAALVLLAVPGTLAPQAAGDRVELEQRLRQPLVPGAELIRRSVAALRRPLACAAAAGPAAAPAACAAAAPSAGHARRHAAGQPPAAPSLGAPPSASGACAPVAAPGEAAEACRPPPAAGSLPITVPSPLPPARLVPVPSRAGGLAPGGPGNRLRLARRHRRASRPASARGRCGSRRSRSPRRSRCACASCCGSWWRTGPAPSAASARPAAA